MFQHKYQANLQSMIYNKLPKMQAESHKWKKTIKGNLNIATVKNPLRNYIEKVLPSVDVKKYPERPDHCLNLSVGDPTISELCRTHKDNLRILADNVGKIDGYTDMQGIVSAREALSNKFQCKAYQLSKDDVYLTSGGSLAIWTTMMLLAQEGDNFLFPSPGFPLALTIARSMKLEPRIYNLDPNKLWHADLSQMEKLIDEKTKFVLVNDPSNPLGACWDKKHKLEIMELCRKHKLPILADQIYEGMTYEEPVSTFAELSEHEDQVIFKCSGLTKKYLGPGWRMGWIILYASPARQAFYRPYLKGIFNVILMPNTIMQASVSEIINSPFNEPRVNECMSLMHQNQKTLKEGLKNEDYCHLAHASGALYATILIKLQKFKGMETSIDFATFLYSQQNMKIFPGDFFMGSVPFIRLVISCSSANINEFLLRFKRFCLRHLTQ